MECKQKNDDNKQCGQNRNYKVIFRKGRTQVNGGGGIAYYVEIVGVIFAYDLVHFCKEPGGFRAFLRQCQVDNHTAVIGGLQL